MSPSGAIVIPHGQTKLGPPAGLLLRETSVLAPVTGSTLMMVLPKVLAT